jgi:predicted O-methyltransferase YrrM
MADDTLMRRALIRAGVPNAENIFSYTHRDELGVLYALAESSRHGAIALEIGSHIGASACYLGAGLRSIGGRLFCVDTWNNETMPEGPQDTFKQFMVNTEGLGDRVTPIRKQSSEIQIQDIQCPLDLVFIDGDHSYDAAKRDFECIEHWLAEKAIVIFHDTVAAAGVCRLMGEILGTCRYRLAGHVRNLSWIRKVDGRP